MTGARKQLLGLVALLIPMLAAAQWNQAMGADEIDIGFLFLAPMIGGTALIFWILFLHLIVCGDSPEGLGFRRPRPLLDLGFGGALAVAMLAFHVLFAATAARWLPPRPPVPQVLEVIAGVSRDPWLLALWLGPVVWIGVALFEELARAFLLRRVSTIWPGRAGRAAAILAVSAVIGGVHAYQGVAAVISIAVQSILLGWFFLRTGRLRALVAAHALYDSVQIVLAVVTIRRMGL